MKLIKKIIAAALALLTIAALAGCSLYDPKVAGDVAMFVDPSSLDEEVDLSTQPPVESAPDGEVVPEAAPEETQTPAPPEESTGNPVETGTEHISEPKIEQEYYIGDGFKFYVPLLWRTTMELDITHSVDHDYEIVSYDFYYVPEEGQSALLMQVIVTSTKYYYTYGISDTTISTRSEDKETLFLLAKLRESLPEDFSNPSEYIEIYQQLAEKGEIVATI